MPTAVADAVRMESRHGLGGLEAHVSENLLWLPHVEELGHRRSEDGVDQAEVASVGALHGKAVQRHAESLGQIAPVQARLEQHVDPEFGAVLDRGLGHQHLDGYVALRRGFDITAEPDSPVGTVAQLVDHLVTAPQHVAQVDGVVFPRLVVVYLLEARGWAVDHQSVAPELPETLGHRDGRGEGRHGRGRRS